MSYQKITQATIATTLSNSDYIFVMAGGTLKRITLDNLRAMMEENQQQLRSLGRGELPQQVGMRGW